MKNHIARKRFGQHFLSDGGIIEAIVDEIAPKPGDAMVEIGPGLAALTQPLVERLGRLTPKHYRPRGRAAPVQVAGEGPLFGDHGGRVARGHWLNGVDED